MLPCRRSAATRRRGRPLEIAQRDGLARLEQFVAEWVTGLAEVPVIHIDAAADDCFSAAQLAKLLARLDDR